MSIRRTLIHPAPSSPLYYRDLPVSIADDPYSGKPRVDSHYADEPQFKFFREIMARGDFTLIDVGANVGLFTRQALIFFGDRICSAFLYEPDIANFRDCLTNLKPWKQCYVSNNALGPMDGRFRLYRDHGNSGNYSIFPGAVANEPIFDVVDSSMIDVATEAPLWSTIDLPLFIKTDTQGFDETLAAAIPLTTWKKTRAAVIELWKIDKPKIDTIAFRTVLTEFPHLWLLNSKRIMTPDLVFEFLAERNGLWDDLALSRKPYQED